MVAGTQKLLFLCNCCSRTLLPSLNDQSCCSGTTGRVKKAEWRQNHCHGGSNVAVVAEWRHSGATVITQWSTLVSQRRHNGGTRKADVSLKSIHNVRIVYWATNGRPLCIHSATTAMCVPSSCLLWATCERPTSSATFVRLFWTCSKLHGDHGVHGDVWTSYVPPLNDQGNRSASLLPKGDLASFVVAQGRHKGRSPCVKGVLATWAQFCKDCYINLHSLLPSHWDSMAVVVGLGWCMTVLSPDVTFHIQQRMGYNCNPTHFVNFNIRSV